MTACSSPPLTRGSKGQPIRGVLVGEGQLSHGSINEIKDFESRTSVPSRKILLTSRTGTETRPYEISRCVAVTQRARNTRSNSPYRTERNYLTILSTVSTNRALYGILLATCFARPFGRYRLCGGVCRASTVSESAANITATVLNVDPCITLLANPVITDC